MAASIGASPPGAQRPGADLVCGAELWDIGFMSGSLPYPESNRVVRVTHVAFTLFRLHRTPEALSKLDSLVERLHSLKRTCAPSEECAELKTAVRRLRQCLATKPPAQLATLTVETFQQDDTAPDGRGTRASGGAYVKIEHWVAVGRTTEDGTLTVRVPSGRLDVSAVVYPSSAGQAFTDLPPRGSGSLAVVLDDSKEPAEETDVVVVDAVDHVIPATFRSLRLQFVRDGDAVPVTRGRQVELLGGDGNVEKDLTDLFSITDGVLIATDVRSLREALARHAGRIAIMRVSAVDADGVTHGNAVWFHVGQHR